jgi:pyruvate dehydrogenase (quinone)
MSSTVSDLLLQCPNKWGLKRIFGFPGDGINGINGAIGRAGDRINYAEVRHEEMSAFMACAHSKFTREAGVCQATSGPGAIHILNGLYDAKMDHPQPFGWESISSITHESRKCFSTARRNLWAPR